MRLRSLSPVSCWNPMQLDPRSPYNPYAAPTAMPQYGYSPNLGLDAPLASRGSRFVGALLDNLIYVVVAVPFVFIGMEDGEPSPIGIGLAALAVLSVAVVQWYLVSTTGQSVAKRWLNMKIVKVDGSDVNFVSGIVLRSWVIAALGAIPFVGNIIGIVDAVMIFGDERRCLHDHIAGTKVIQVG